MYLNNLKQRDTNWNDEEYEYAMQVRDDLEGKFTNRSKRRGDYGEEKIKERTKE